MWVKAFLLQLASSTEDGTCLHGCDFGECDTETATTVTKHWVVLGERSHTLLDNLHIYAHFLSHHFLTLQVMWNELMQWWVKQTDVHVETVHSLEDSVEVGLLIWEQFGKGFFTTFNSVGKNHLAHGDNLLVIEKHVLCTSQTNTLGTECTSHLGVVWRVGVGANLQLGVFIAEIHECFEVTTEFSSLCLDFACINLTCRAIQRDEVAFLVGNAFDFNSLCLVVNIDSTCTRNAALTHTTSHHSSVRSHTATSREDAFC